MASKIPAFLQDLPGDELRDALYWLAPLHVEYGTVLMSPGDDDASLVIVADGELVVQCDGLDVASIPTDGIAGEMELFGGSARKGLVKAVRPTSMLVLEREGYEALRDAGNRVAWAIEREVSKQLAKRLRAVDERLDVLAVAGLGVEVELPQPGWVERVGRWLRRGLGTPDRNVPDELAALSTFALTRPEAREDLASRFVLSHWRAGRVVCRQHEVADRAWVVLEGRLDAVRHVGDRAVHVGALGAGDIGGTVSLLGDATRCATLLTVEDSVLLEITADGFRELFDAEDLVGSALRTALIRSVAGQLAIAEARLAELDAERRRHIAASLAPLWAGTIAG